VHLGVRPSLLSFPRGLYGKHFALVEAEFVVLPIGLSGAVVPSVALNGSVLVHVYGDIGFEQCSLSQLCLDFRLSHEEANVEGGCFVGFATTGESDDEDCDENVASESFHYLPVERLSDAVQKLVFELLD